MATTPASTQELPGYNSNGNARPAQPTTTAATSRRPKEFEYKIEKSGRPIAVLTLFSEAALSKNIPTYVEGSMIKGNLRLSLGQGDSVRSVTITVQGQFITGVNPEDQLNFIDITKTLWSQSDGAPKNATADHDSSSPPTDEQPSTKFNGKLQGEYLWPFAIDLPKKVNLSLDGRSDGRQASEPFAPPQTFNERTVRAGIHYEISVRIARGRFRLSTQFGYIPTIKPPPFLPLRRLAYQEGTKLLGPHVDTEGWHSQDPVQVQGRIFDNRPVNVACKLYISKPLSYTRGSVIPLYLHLESDDQEALDLLSSPKGIAVHLRRHVNFGILEKKANAKVISYQSTVEDSLPAVWWPSIEENNPPASDRRRYVNGELHLKVGLKPSSDMPLLHVEYFVVVLPFKTTGFVHSGEDVLLKQPVDIATIYAPGPRPVKSAPPGYDLEIPSNPTFTSAKNNFL
ncbi:hypothetical protein BDN70DRAFT_933059 [Pholiota conissans]|uniref:Arrestin-like N-terminal domain-containing protein n=1 Tax=Pholiota conissans TaxID=109636 RepID=A0A9P5Z2E4_9AGAR|nr:hypothetical protein BDN70DRAFT_933059 [Pholiota conissans]